LFEGAAEVSRRFDVRIVVLFMGAARIKERGSAASTMRAANGIETAKAFPKATIVPVSLSGLGPLLRGPPAHINSF